MSEYLDGEQQLRASHARRERISKVTPQDQQVFKYDAVLDEWVPAPAGGGGGIQIHGNEYHDPDFSEHGHVHTENDILDLGATVCLDAELGAHANNPNAHHPTFVLGDLQDFGKTLKLARLEIDNAGIHLSMDAFGNLTLTDAITGTKTLAELSAEGEMAKKITLIDNAPPYVYFGFAEPGSATSDPVWQILRREDLGGGDGAFLYGDGDSNFDNVWDARTLLEYA